MSKLRIILLFLSVIIFGTQISKLLVESKALLCHPSPKWTVNNGSDPMNESKGNVTLVTLINASYRFGLKQASSMENMLKFLKKSGLKDIHFIAINSKDSDALEKLNELTIKVSFAVYQESDTEVIWSALDGGKDDMFIYDRCGLLTYYIPFPLSIIHAQQPILQAALLSTYFDNPCGESCDSSASDTSPTTTTTISSANVSVQTDMILSSGSLTVNISAVNMTLEEILNPELTDGSNGTEVNVSAIELKDEEVFAFETTETNNISVFAEDFSGSGSGDEPIEQFIELSTESNKSEIENNTDVKEVEEWKILDFFRPNDNRSDKEIFDEIYNKSITELESIAKSKVERVNETTTESPVTIQLTESPVIWNDSRTTSSPLPETTAGQHMRTRIAFFNSASKTKCQTFNESMCMEWSTDRLLRARLCCLTEVVADEDSGFGCGHFEKQKCNRMLPLIKCCLKDFSQLLESYFQSIRVTPRPSRQRNRY